MTSSRGDDKRPIDTVRESALSMQIGGPEDGAIAVMIDMGMALYVVKEHAIYAGQLADQVDPGRTNVAVPNTQQRLLSIGSHDPKAARIFLTTYTMFKSMHRRKSTALLPKRTVEEVDRFIDCGGRQEAWRSGGPCPIHER